jgi:hypothetical protein
MAPSARLPSVPGDSHHKTAPHLFLQDDTLSPLLAGIWPLLSS